MCVQTPRFKSRKLNTFISVDPQAFIRDFIAPCLNLNDLPRTPDGVVDSLKSCVKHAAGKKFTGLIPKQLDTAISGLKVRKPLVPPLLNPLNKRISRSDVPRRSLRLVVVGRHPGDDQPLPVGRPPRPPLPVAASVHLRPRQRHLVQRLRESESVRTGHQIHLPALPALLPDGNPHPGNLRVSEQRDRDL